MINEYFVISYLFIFIIGSFVQIKDVNSKKRESFPTLDRDSRELFRSGLMESLIFSPCDLRDFVDSSSSSSSSSSCSSSSLRSSVLGECELELISSASPF